MATSLHDPNNPCMLPAPMQYFNAPMNYDVCFNFPDLVTSSGLELIKCGGRCGTSSCAAHFASKEDLSRHVKMSRLLQCRHVSQFSGWWTYCVSGTVTVTLYGMVSSCSLYMIVCVHVHVHVAIVFKCAIAYSCWNMGHHTQLQCT